MGRAREAPHAGEARDDDATATPATDEEIVARVLAGDTALYEIVMRRHNQRLYRTVRSILSDESEVEDVLQEAYLSAYHHLAEFAGRARFSTWLVRIAVNKALDRQRRSGRVVALEACGPAASEAWPGVEPLATRIPDPEQESASLELVALLGRAIDALPIHYRSVYVLREVEDLDTREVADCLMLSEGTVKTRLHRARAMLREALDRDLGVATRKMFIFGGHRCDDLVAAVLPRLTGGPRLSGDTEGGETRRP